MFKVFYRNIKKLEEDKLVQEVETKCGAQTITKYLNDHRPDDTHLFMYCEVVEENKEEEK